MRILFIHEVNYLKKPIFEMHEFPEYLADKGHQIGFLHFAEGSSSKQIKEAKWRQRTPGRVLESVKIDLFTPGIPNGGLPGRLFLAITGYWHIKRAIREFSPDVIVSFAAPTLGWQSLLAAKKLGIPFVFRALDVSHKIRKSIFNPLVKMAEKFLYRNSALISANNPAMAQYCLSMGASPDSVKVDLPPLDLDHFKTTKNIKSHVRESLGIPKGARVTLYMGSFFYFSGLPQLVEEFAKSASESDYLVLVGGGEQEKQLRSLVAEFNLDKRVLFPGFVSFERLPGMLAIADVAVNPMERTLVSNAAFPNKVIQYMAAGLPVVSTNLDGLRLTFRNNPGLALEKDASHVMERALELQANKSNLAKLGKLNLDAVSRKFSKAGAIDVFEQRLSALGRPK